MPKLIKRFSREEEGGLVIFSLFMMVCMLLAVGIAIDVMRTEHMRTRLQIAADSAVLAAADLDQILTPAEVVEDYFARAGLSAALDGSGTTAGVNSRTVTANANFAVPSMFLNMVGINSLNAPATGTANETISDIEISLVLDITGSMGSNGKMANLRLAANDFIDTVIRDDAPGAVSVSLVPYTAQVNVGPALMGQLNVTQEHNYSHCVDFEEEDFEDTAVSLTASYDQMEHYQYYASATSPIDNPGCPTRTFERVMPFTENVAALQGNISQFTPRANTAIHIGMKWGVALLDPAMRPVVSNLIAMGEADATFAGRPYAWDRENTKKFVVLMTDGQNVNTRRLHDWAYATTELRERWNDFSTSQYAAANSGSPAWWEYDYTKYTSAQADDMLDTICTAAKNKGITVFSIGFEVDPYPASVMESCASSSSHFYKVEGLEIQTAFNAIARQINQLRLTQ
ncbi:hypothetical protein IV417_15510 [Alphaproteobacteria bacterium KMM 3653]|uniref:VWFA domain-containing protein n=2 Tax=Harenicola maris TaxID=2841044 RepID=A0AAP2G8Y7_9RHOB|nr:hypothetical protein [Harenicola maris]